MHKNWMTVVLLALCAVALMEAAAPASNAPASPAAGKETLEQLAAEVRARETSFAKSMADRDHAAFAAHVAGEAVFFGGRGVLRGKTAVVDAWKRFYEGKEAPFSWAPEKVEVLESGTLGLSSGPVYDPAGKRTGTFNSIWRREADGQWRIIFDNGCPPCDCGAEGSKPGL